MVVNWNQDLSKKLDDILLQLDVIACSTSPQREAPSLKFDISAFGAHRFVYSKQKSVAATKTDKS